MSTEASFRFDAATHAYSDLRGRIPNITSLLELAGYGSDWYTDEGRDRGSAVHALTAQYDLDALDVGRCVSPFRGYLLAHVQAMAIVPHGWHSIEEPMVHGALRFAGTCDRVGKIYGAVGVWEIKSGDPDKAHPIQTAFQAILAAPAYGLPPESLTRYVCYLTARGRFKVERHPDRRDFLEARRILRDFGGR